MPTLSIAIVKATNESSYQVNRGEVEGYNGIPATSKNPDYLSGYQQGVAYRNATFTKPTLPAYTDDNYKDFYIGYQDGKVPEDHDYNANNLHFDSCPTRHSQEYCSG